MYRTSRRRPGPGGVPVAVLEVVADEAFGIGHNPRVRVEVGPVDRMREPRAAGIGVEDVRREEHELPVGVVREPGDEVDVRQLRGLDWVEEAERVLLRMEVVPDALGL